jgi:hypothetical protein
VAGQLRLWQGLAIVGFAALGLALQVWKAPGARRFWAGAWAFWVFICFLGALAVATLLASFPFQAGPWCALWRGLDWELGLWYLGSLPALIFISLDLRRDRGGFERSWAALAAGMAFGPLVMGAFPSALVSGIAAPFVLLLAASRVLPGSSRALTPPLLTLAGVNALLFFHGVFQIPEAFGAALLAGLLSLGLCPYGRQSALAGLGLAWTALALKTLAAWPSSPGTLLGICALIVLGWFVFRHRLEKPIVTSP